MVAKKEHSTDEIAELICQLWQPLSPEEQQMVKSHICVKKIRKNDILYKQFDTPQMLMCLIYGKVKVYKDGVGGRLQIIRAIKPVEMFGYRAFFAQQNYQTSAVALEPSIVALFPLAVLSRLMSTSLSVNQYFVRQLSAMLGASDERTVSLTQKHIRGRLAEALLFLRDNYGLEPDGYTLSIYLSREDLASLSNMTTSNAIRTLSAFANERIIAIDGRKIKIINEAQLNKISSMG